MKNQTAARECLQALLIFLTLAFAALLVMHFRTGPTDLPVSSTLDAEASTSKATTKRTASVSGSAWPAADTAAGQPPQKSAEALPAAAPETSSSATKANDEEVKQNITEALTRDPQDEAAVLAMGIFELTRQNNPRGALPYLQKALQANPQNEIAINTLMDAYEADGELDRGFAFLQTLEEQAPDSDASMRGRVHIGLKQGRQQEVIAFLQKSAAENPLPGNRGVITELLGDSYAAGGNAPEAVSLYANALSSCTEEEKCIRLHIKKFQSLLASGRHQEAHAEMAKLAESFPNNPAVVGLQDPQSSGT